MDETAKLAIKQGFNALFKDANSKEDYAMLAAAEQIVIGFYFDMIKVMFLHQIQPEEKMEIPDIGPMCRAVEKINQICEKQGKETLFKGDLNNPLDLFNFAEPIGLEALKDSQSKTKKGE